MADLLFDGLGSDQTSKEFVSLTKAMLLHSNKLTIGHPYLDTSPLVSVLWSSYILGICLKNPAESSYLGR